MPATLTAGCIIIQSTQTLICFDKNYKMLNCRIHPFTLHKKWSFSSRISSVNTTKWKDKNELMVSFIFCAVLCLTKVAESRSTKITLFANLPWKYIQNPMESKARMKNQAKLNAYCIVWKAKLFSIFASLSSLT